MTHSPNSLQQSTSQPAQETASPMEAQSPIMKCKVCITCNGSLPFSYFGARKETKEGKFSACKACVNEAKRRRYEAKYGRARRLDLDHGPQRNVIRHNRELLNILMTSPDIHIYGYDPITLKTYKVYWGLNKTIQMPSLAMFDMNVTLYREWISSGDSKFTDHLVEYLKTHNIRLELTEADIVISKRVVYYLNV